MMMVITPPTTDSPLPLPPLLQSISFRSEYSRLRIALATFGRFSLANENNRSFVFHCFIEQWYFYRRTMVTWRRFIGFRIEMTSCASNFQRLVSVPFLNVTEATDSRFQTLAFSFALARGSIASYRRLFFLFFPRYLGLLLWGIPTLGSTPL